MCCIMICVLVYYYFNLLKWRGVLILILFLLCVWLFFFFLMYLIISCSIFVFVLRLLVIIVKFLLGIVRFSRFCKIDKNLFLGFFIVFSDVEKFIYEEKWDKIVGWVNLLY